MVKLVKLSDQVKLVIEFQSKLHFIEVMDIVMIEKVLRKTVVTTKDGRSFETYISLKEFEQKLPDNYFFRTHKSYIINMCQIMRIEPYSSTISSVIFKGLKKGAFITKERYKILLEMI
ncbi:LytTR family DNA-binding domain-containing protein [Bacillus carboniphilus]|uniref:LytTR family DNA-binding domain-containing protein n=1 Tax=Bacillus carboniphilus TaxID=86663 RepID=A0ABY9JX01_9BACI|nr:LytTR family DNA-binding domain-containing protein [Bacillus carboniphilus]WLR43033.1 LytTR family DNA-binding domain-containing protein [Bacillus carboniphilus]